jgi:hypothetical protein
MQLGFCAVGRPYPLAALGQLEQRIAAHMAQLGLLYTLKAVGGGGGACCCRLAVVPERGG